MKLSKKMSPRNLDGMFKLILLNYWENHEKIFVKIYLG